MVAAEERPYNILVVDAETPIRMALEALLRKKRCRYASARDAAEALAWLQRERFDLVITDVQLGAGQDGLEVVRAAVAQASAPAVLVLAALGSVELALEAVKAGAWDFMEKPFASLEELEAAIDAALAHHRPEAAAGEEAGDAFAGIVGSDGAVRAIFEVIRRLADTDATVLLTGESGTGKELFARAIHEASQRRSRPFVPVNCGAIPEALLESELFGSRKGAYTGASSDRQGRFQAAEGGTIFLDEIGEMPVALQVKLLRVLQNREIQPVGAPTPVPVYVRVVAATHVKLEEAVAAGRFREDLYWRLNVIPIQVPALRERRGDILAIASHVLERVSARLGRRAEGFTEEAARRILAYSWPGNVRELENVIERVVILKGPGRIHAEDLPSHIQAPLHKAAPPSAAPQAPLSVEALLHAASQWRLPPGGVELPRLIAALEDALIDAALEQSGGNRAEAARLLGLNRTTLVERLKRRGRLSGDQRGEGGAR